jgi:hypothetical protein
MLEEYGAHAVRHAASFGWAATAAATAEVYRHSIEDLRLARVRELCGGQ